MTDLLDRDGTFEGAPCGHAASYLAHASGSSPEFSLSVSRSHTGSALTGVEVVAHVWSKHESCRDRVPGPHYDGLDYRHSTRGRPGSWILLPI